MSDNEQSGRQSLQKSAGVASRPGLGSAEAPEPHAGLGASRAIPNAGEVQQEIASMWLWLGRTVGLCVTEGADWICEDPKSAKMAVEWLDIAEDCMLRAVMVSQGEFLPASGGVTRRAETTGSVSEANSTRPEGDAQ